MIVHQSTFRGLPADMEFPFGESLAASKDGAIHHMDHAQSGVVPGGPVRYLIGNVQKPRKTGPFR
jgi:hypothetical protein